MTATSSIFDALTPVDLGLPPKFSTFRLAQRQGLEWLDTDCHSPISAACMPTGVGKTAWAVAYAKLLGVKAAYLVVTKALQKQVLDDFSSIGMVDVRGRVNYHCQPYGNCDTGHDQECSLSKTLSCPYTAAVERAKDSSLVETNYSYWMHARKHNRSALERDLRPIDLLICDEAHRLEEQLASFASVKFYPSELARIGGWKWSEHADESGLMPDAVWLGWARQVIDKCDPDDDDERDLADRCNRVINMGSNWVWQFSDNNGRSSGTRVSAAAKHGELSCTFEPIGVSGYAKRLFSGVPRVLLMSASLTQFAMRLILRDDDDPNTISFDYRSWPQVFNPANAPVYHIPTRKLSWKSTDEDYKAIVEAADQIIDNRGDRKGILHTVSYARTRRALQYSRHNGRFIWNEGSHDLQSSLGRYRSAPAGTVLVTPSVEEGFDFPADQCRYQIVLKFPFPNETQRVIKERCTRIPGYRLHYAAQKIVQMRGRPIRSADDWAETFILDNSVAQLNGAEGRSYLPPGFRLFTVTQAPEPPR